MEILELKCLDNYSLSLLFDINDIDISIKDISNIHNIDSETIEKLRNVLNAGRIAMIKDIKNPNLTSKYLMEKYKKYGKFLYFDFYLMEIRGHDNCERKYDNVIWSDEMIEDLCELSVRDMRYKYKISDYIIAKKRKELGITKLTLSSKINWSNEMLYDLKYGGIGFASTKYNISYSAALKKYNEIKNI